MRQLPFPRLLGEGCLLPFQLERLHHHVGRLVDREVTVVAWLARINEPAVRTVLEPHDGD